MSKTEYWLRDSTGALKRKIVVDDTTGHAEVVDAADATVIDLESIPENKLANYGLDGLHPKRIARVTYDYNEHGGAVGTIGLGVTLPKNALVVRGYYYQHTVFASEGSATVEFGYEGDTDAFIAQAAYNNTQYDIGSHDGVSDGAAANFHGPLSEAKEVAITIGTAALTAGKLILFLEYVITD
ncbi:MAG: hypothetical protein N2V75_04050 [Methanophagales archaeon]|nr:hypothetical protein [Methanophagales archaeon]